MTVACCGTWIASNAGVISSTAAGMFAASLPVTDCPTPHATSTTPSAMTRLASNSFLSRRRHHERRLTDAGASSGGSSRAASSATTSSSEGVVTASIVPGPEPRPSVRHRWRRGRERPSPGVPRPCGVPAIASRGADEDRDLRRTQPPRMSAQGSSEGARRGLAGRVLGERYRVVRMVSAGSSTLIADAEDTELGRPVTVKLVRPEIAESAEFRRRFEATMRAMAKLSHPNIAAVHDWGEEEVGRRTTVYAVVEHLGGGSLRDLFDRNRWLEPSQALVVGLEVCRGLDFAHRKHLVHGGLTPSKLVFGADRRLRIVDFGLARLLAADDWKEPSTVPTHVARYSSPEQALGQPIDGRSDVYSLALILVEAVTGTVPFAARSTVATLSARVGRLMPVSADLGPLASVLERAGRPDPADRSSASELGRSLVRAAEKLPRPSPIPILVASRFDEDPSQLRRP